jgi:hypothetical protein
MKFRKQDEEYSSVRSHMHMLLGLIGLTLFVFAGEALIIYMGFSTGDSEPLMVAGPLIFVSVLWMYAASMMWFALRELNLKMRAIRAFPLVNPQVEDKFSTKRQTTPKQSDDIKPQ